MNRKRLIALGLAGTLGLFPAVSGVSVFADDTDYISSINASIDDLQTQKDELLGQIDDLQSQLVTTIASVKHVDSQLSDLQDQIKQTEADLESANKDRDAQHEAMKKRIQYIYEQGGNEGWIAVFLSDGDLNAWLNQNMTEDMYKYDRKQLEDYAAAVSKVQELQEKQQEEKSQLESKKTSLAEGQSHLESLISEAREKYSASDFDTKIADAYAKADEYAELVAAQNESISELVSIQTDGSTDTAGTVDTTTEEAQTTINQVAQELAQQTGADISTATAAATQAYAQSGTIGNGSTASGAAILAYAQQFLGNKYVYGGNSLTDGVDCSGFVQQVYKNFGISTDRTSYDIANDGREVSYSDAQVGDVFVYDGHVGIYAGNGQIINAANEREGITYTPADYDQIQTIRRLIPDEDGDDTSSVSSSDTSSVSADSQ